MRLKFEVLQAWLETLIREQARIHVPNTQLLPCVWVALANPNSPFQTQVYPKFGRSM